MAQSVLQMVGNTPLIELSRMQPKSGVRLFAKWEGGNPSGSIKDRVALALLEDAERNGELSPGDTLVEASSGNTALAVAMLAKQKGYKVRIVLPEGLPPGIRDLLDMYGVTVEWTGPHLGMKGAIDVAKQIGREPGHCALLQFERKANVLAHYNGTGQEILQSLDRVDAFVAGIGTGGTLAGVTMRLRERFPDVKTYGVEPRMGERLQGLRSMAEGYIPPLLDLRAINGRFLVDAATAMRRAAEVLEREGLFVGISAGAVMEAAVRIASRMESGNIVVTFADAGWKYLPSNPWRSTHVGEKLDETHWW